MYQIQQDKLLYFNKQINNPTRKITYRFTLNDKALPIDNVMDNPVLTTDSGLDQYGVGSALTTQLQMSVKKEVRIIPKDKIKIEIGLEIFNEATNKNEIVYSPLGTFYVDVIEEKGITKSLKAYDNMYKLNKGYFPTTKHTTTQAIANDIARANGLKVKGVANVNINNEQLDGKSCIEMLSLIASAMGTNVRISRSGDTIEFVEPVATGLTFDESRLSTATLDDSTSYNITKLRVNYSDKVTDDKGATIDEGYFTVGTGGDANTLAINNPLLKGKQSQANDILNKIKKLNGYKRFDTSMPLADYRIEPMDLVTYSKGGVKYLVPILYSKMTLSYQGVGMETQSPVLAPTKSEFSFKGTLSQKVENIYSDIIQVKELTANKVSTEVLEATIAEIEKLYAQKAEINELVAGTIVVENLKAEIASIDKLVANKAEINDLNALSATINDLKAKVADIDTLISNSILAEIIQAGSISSDLLNVKDGFIKDAMISSLSASKIDTGVINTNNVTVQSENGNMLLQGNLLQFKDKNGKVRIQIGQDTKGNYTFTLYDETGKGVLINEKGVQSSNAIKDGLIVDSKVSDNANISGSKLNISSLYDSMNADGSKTLKASKVLLDDKNQTLDVSFKEMTTKQDGLESSMNTAITDISVSKGQISQLIQDTTIESNGQTTKLKDAYNHTKSTVDSHSIAIGNVESTVNAHDGQIGDLSKETANLKVGLGGIEAGLSSLEKNVNDNYYTKTQTDSQIKIAKDSITSEVSKTYETKTEVDNKINAIEVGATNLVPQSSTLNNQFNELGTYRGNRNVIDDPTARGGKYVEFTCRNAGVGFYLVLWRGDDSCVGQQYTWSFYAKMNKARKLDNIGHERGGRTSIDVTTEWKKFTHTWTYSATGNSAFTFYPFFEVGDILCIKDFKIERGNRATDWSPAPEDLVSPDNFYTKVQTDSKIEQKATEIASTVSRTEINNMKIGGANLLLGSHERKQLDRPTTNYNQISYNIVDTYKNLGLTKDTTFSLTFLVDRVANTQFECFDTITFTSGWVLRWTRDDIQEIIHMKGNTYKFIMKPKKLPRGLSLTNKLTFIGEYQYGGGIFYNVMLTEGDKPMDWSHAGVDISTTSEMNSAIQQKADSILSTVSQSYVTNDKLNNYSTTTQMNSAIEQKANSITQSVAQTYATKGDVSSTYATKSELSQTSNAINATFKSSGGYNLLKNGKASLDVSYWISNGGGINRASDSVYGTCFYTEMPSGMRYAGGNPSTPHAIRLKNNTHYVFQGMVYSRTSQTGHGVTPLHFWCSTSHTTAGQAQCSIVDYSQRTVAGRWEKCYVHFLTKPSGEVWFSPFIYGLGSGAMWVTELALIESQVPLPYSPHPNEVYDGVTHITKDGIRVSQSNVGTYTHMSANGFFVRMNNGTPLFEATNKVALYDNKGTSCVQIVNDPSQAYGNSRIDVRGGINFIHNPGISVGTNQILLGNHDVSDQYGMHNLAIRCHNTLGFQDNWGLTHMFFKTRTGDIVMKGRVYQNTATPPRSFSMNFDGEDEVYRSGFTRSQAVDAVMHLKTGVHVDADGDYCSAIYGGHDELITTKYKDKDGVETTHINTNALNASLVVTCQEQQKLIEAQQEQLAEQQEQIDSLQQQLDEIKQMLMALNK